MNNQLSSSKIKTRVAVSIFFFLSGFTFSTWASRIPDLQRLLQLNDAELGSLLILLPLGLMVTMPLAGYLLSRYSSRYIMLIGSIFYSLLLCLLGLANTVWQVGIILFLFGSSRNLFNISVNTQAVGVQDFYTKSIMATFHGIWSIAGFAGAAAAYFIIANDVSVALHFFSVSAVAFIVIAVTFKNTLVSDAHPHQKNPAFIFPDKPLIKLGIIAFCSMVCEGTISEWGSIYFGKEVHAPKNIVTIGYVVYLSAMTIGRFTGDWLVNKIGTKRLLQISGILILTGISIVILFPFIISATAGYLLIGFGVSCIMPLVFSTAGKISAMGHGPAITSVSTIGYLGFLSGPPLIGFISHAINMRVSFLLIIVAACTIIFFSSRIKS
jgi:MFS family permease